MEYFLEKNSLAGYIAGLLSVCVVDRRGDVMYSKLRDGETTLKDTVDYIMGKLILDKQYKKYKKRLYDVLEVHEVSISDFDYGTDYELEYGEREHITMLRGAIRMMYSRLMVYMKLQDTATVAECDKLRRKFAECFL
jgi:hypothetical protein